MAVDVPPSVSHELATSYFRSFTSRFSRSHTRLISGHLSASSLVYTIEAQFALNSERERERSLCVLRARVLTLFSLDYARCRRSPRERKRLLRARESLGATRTDTLNYVRVLWLWVYTYIYTRESVQDREREDYTHAQAPHAFPFRIAKVQRAIQPCAELSSLARARVLYYTEKSSN